MDPDPYPDSLEMLDPDSMNPALENTGTISGSREGGSLMLEVLVKDLALTESRLLPGHLNKKHRTLIHSEPEPVPVYLSGHNDKTGG